MSARLRWAGLAVGVLMTASAGAALARTPPPCAVDVVSRVNKDQSFIKVVTRTCQGMGQRTIDVRFSTHTGRPTRWVARGIQALPDGPGSGAELVDWDRDGQHEVLLTGACFSVNCDHQLLRLDRTRRRLEQVYRGFGMEVFKRHGYLVNSARDSCCAWAEEAYKVLEPHGRVAAAPSFSVITVSDAMEEAVRGRVTCLFPSGQGPGHVIEHVLPRRTGRHAIDPVLACEAQGQKLGRRTQPASAAARDDTSLTARLPAYQRMRSGGTAWSPPVFYVPTTSTL